MKKSKTFALILSAAMGIQMLPMCLAQAADAEEYRVDFNGIESVSEISSLGLKSDENAEIIQENGNGFLKVSGDQVIRFRAPAAYQGNVIVEFKYRTEGEAYQSVAGQPMWGMAGSSEGGFAIRNTLYSTGMISYDAPNDPSHSWTVTQMNQDSEWHTMKYLINTETQRGQMYLDQKLITIWGQSDLQFLNSVVDIQSLLFNNDSQNTMYFDDIVIKNAPSANGVWDFEEYANASEVPDLTMSGTTSIVADDNGNKMLKAEKNSKVVFSFPKTQTNRVKIKFKLKSDNALTAANYDMGNFGALYNGDTMVTRAKGNHRNVQKCKILLQKRCDFGGFSCRRSTQFGDPGGRYQK